MRTIIFIVLVTIVTTTLKAQTYLPGSFLNNSYRGSFANNFRWDDDSSANRKWFFTSYSAISSSFVFFKGRNASIISAPIGLQLNRRLTNNLYAFAGVSAAPAYVNFNRSFITNNVKENYGSIFSTPGSAGLYSRAELGLQYINDERTFSISGSIGVERSSYPVLPYNNTRTNHVMSSK